MCIRDRSLYCLTTSSTSSSFVLNHPLLGLFLLNSAIMPLLPGASKLCFNDRLPVSQKNPSFLKRSILLTGLNCAISLRLFATISSRIVLIALRLIFLMTGKLCHFQGYPRRLEMLRQSFYTCPYNAMPLLHWPVPLRFAPNCPLPL